MLAILKQLDTEGDVKNSAIESLKSTALVLVGAGVGAAIGKPSLLIGIGTTFIAHYMDSPRLSTIGAGMIAGGGIKIASGGVGDASVGGLEGVKERIKAFGSDIKDRLYVDRFIKPKTTQGTDGLGEVQYFKYPNTELDMGTLNNLENEIARSSEAYDNETPTGGLDDISGIEDRIL
jgi:hypothetical protein